MVAQGPDSRTHERGGGAEEMTNVFFTNKKSTKIWNDLSEIVVKLKHNSAHELVTYDPTVNIHVRYKDRQSESNTACEYIILFTRCGLEVTTCFGLCIVSFNKIYDLMMA